MSLFREMQRLAHHPTAPPEERRLGEVLSLVLMGDRQPDLSGLPEDMVDEISMWVEGLGNASTPGRPAEDADRNRTN